MIEELKIQIMKKALSTPLQFNDTLNDVYVLTKYILNRTNSSFPIHDTLITNEMFIDNMLPVLESRFDIINHKTLHIIFDNIIRKYGSSKAIEYLDKEK